MLRRGLSVGRDGLGWRRLVIGVVGEVRRRRAAVDGRGRVVSLLRVGWGRSRYGGRWVLASLHDAGRSPCGQGEVSLSELHKAGAARQQVSRSWRWCVAEVEEAVPSAVSDEDGIGAQPETCMT